MRWARRALYALPLLVAGGAVLLILVLDLLGAWCSGKDSGTYYCNPAGDAAWIVFYLAFPLTAISIVVWPMAKVRLIVRRRQTMQLFGTQGP